jgi:hypothetical protein
MHAVQLHINIHAFVFARSSVLQCSDAGMIQLVCSVWDSLLFNYWWSYMQGGKVLSNAKLCNQCSMFWRSEHRQTVYVCTYYQRCYVQTAKWLDSMMVEQQYGILCAHSVLPKRVTCMTRYEQRS